MQTLLLKLAPGTVYPRHRHKRVEQCLVLSGDVIQKGAMDMVAGNFEWIEAGTTHDDVSSQGGCELLIIGSIEDEVEA